MDSFSTRSVATSEVIAFHQFHISEHHRRSAVTVNSCGCLPTTPGQCPIFSSTSQGSKWQQNEIGKNFFSVTKSTPSAVIPRTSKVTPLCVGNHLLGL